jgi:hypothetical protein
VGSTQLFGAINGVAFAPQGTIYVTPGVSVNLTEEEAHARGTPEMFNALEVFTPAAPSMYSSIIDPQFPGSTEAGEGGATAMAVNAAGQFIAYYADPMGLGHYGLFSATGALISEVNTQPPIRRSPPSRSVQEATPSTQPTMPTGAHARQPTSRSSRSRGRSSGASGRCPTRP